MKTSQQKILNWITVVMAVLQALTSIFHPQASQTSGVEAVVNELIP